MAREGGAIPKQEMRVLQEILQSLIEGDPGIFSFGEPHIRSENLSDPRMINAMKTNLSFMDDPKYGPERGISKGMKRAQGSRVARMLLRGPRNVIKSGEGLLDQAIKDVTAGVGMSDLWGAEQMGLTPEEYAWTAEGRRRRGVRPKLAQLPGTKDVVRKMVAASQEKARRKAALRAASKALKRGGIFGILASVGMLPLLMGGGDER